MKTCVSRCVSRANSCFCYSWSSCRNPSAPSVSWWRKGQAFRSHGRRTWHYTSRGPNTPPSPRPPSAPHRLWTRTAAPPSRHSWYWSKTRAAARLGSVPKHYALLGFSEGVCACLQDNMERASQCRLAKVALCSNSQNIWDLLGAQGMHEVRTVHSNVLLNIFKQKAYFKCPPPAQGWQKLQWRW